MGVVSDIERQLGRLRAREADDGMPELRTSTMTHIVWCPPELAPEGARDPRRPARAPSRPDDLPDPVPGQRGEDRHARGAEGLPAPGSLAGGALGGDRAPAAEAPPPSTRARSCCRCSSPTCPCSAAGAASPAGGACPSPRSSASPTVSSSTRRSGATSRRPTRCSQELFDSVAVSDIAFSRTLPWRRRLAELWPEIGGIEKLRVEGPRADAELVAGWLRSRLKRDVTLTRRDAPAVRAMWVDGEPVESPGELLNGSELLSAELDQFGRNAVYEAAVRAVVVASRSSCSRHRAPSSSSAAAVRLARPDPNVVMRPLSAGCVWTAGLWAG